MILHNLIEQNMYETPGKLEFTEVSIKLSSSVTDNPTGSLQIKILARK